MSLHVNLGCGPFPAGSWVNVDAQPLPGVDVVATASDLPFDAHTVGLMYAGHVFEHMTYLDQLPKALAEIRRVLAFDAVLMVVGPDLNAALYRFPAEVPGIMPTDPDGADPAAHSWPCTAPMMRAALEHAGFTTAEMGIDEVPEPWPVVSRIGWQFAIEARP